MDYDFRTCTHCGKSGSKRMMSEVIDYGPGGPGLSPGENETYRIYHCDNPQCLKNFFVHTVLNLKGRKIEEGTTRFEYPLPKTITHHSIPSKIADSYIEAIKCLNLGALNAASIMFRRVLEQVCKDKGATGKNLPKKIDSIIESKTLKNMMNIVKEFGVLANHDDRYDYEIESDDVPKLQKFIEHLFKELYITPYELGGLQKTLDKNRKTSA